MTTKRRQRRTSWSSERCGMGERVSAYIDDETSEVEAAAVRQHLAACASCREFVAFGRGARETMRATRAPRFATRPSPAQLSAVMRPRRRTYASMRRSIMGLAAALMVGVLMGAIGMEVAINESETAASVTATLPEPTAVTLYEPKIAPGTPLDPDFVRYFETAPKPAMAFPVVWVIEPLPPDPSFRWAGLESGESYPEGYRIEVVTY